MCPTLLVKDQNQVYPATAFKGAIISQKDATPSVVEPPEEPTS